MTQNQIAYQNMMETKRKDLAHDKREDFLTPYKAGEMYEHVLAMESGRKKDVTQAIKNVLSGAVGFITGTGGFGK